jgi:hypothetical protein
MSGFALDVEPSKLQKRPIQLSPEAYATPLGAFDLISRLAAVVW